MISCSLCQEKKNYWAFWIQSTACWTQHAITVQMNKTNYAIYLFTLRISEKILSDLLFIMGGLPRNNLILVCLAYLECEPWEEGVPKMQIFHFTIEDEEYWRVTSKIRWGQQKFKPKIAFCLIFNSCVIL